MVNVVQLDPRERLVYDGLRYPALEVRVEEPLEAAGPWLPLDWTDEEAARPVLSPHPALLWRHGGVADRHHGRHEGAVSLRFPVTEVDEVPD